MVCLIVFGYRSFGSCDYFKIGDAETDRTYHINTLFFHVSFLPLCPVKSYIADHDDCCCAPKALIELPDVPGRSVGWAWLRTLTFLGFFLPIVIWALTVSDSYDENWRLILAVVFSIVSLVAYIGLMIYRPQASEESRQEYIQVIRETIGRAVAERCVIAVRQTNVQAQVEQAKPLQPPSYSDSTAPQYDYDQGPIQTYRFPTHPNMQQQQPQPQQRGANII